MRAIRVATAAFAALGVAACGVDPEPRALPAYRIHHAGLRADLTEQDAAVVPIRDARWAFQTAPRRFGCGGALGEVGAARPAQAGGRVEYRRPGLVEWYAETEAGIEQGFTLPSPPCGERGRGVVVELGRGLRAAVSAGGRDAWLRDEAGRDVLRYTGLAALDATGRPLPAVLEARDEGLAIRVDDTRAVYPVEIDPTIWAPSATLTPSDGTPGDDFGESIALSGDTVVVGAPIADGNRGAAYVFVRTGTTWAQQAKLVASDGVVDDQLGTAVAVSGDTAVIGAPRHDAPAGAVYVFDRTGTTWSLTQQILPPAGSSAQSFGESLALSGDTALVGAAGAAFVYVRSGSTWALEQTLTAASAGAPFGSPVALSGDTAVVGAPPTNGGVWIFARTGTTWSQQASFPPSPTGNGIGAAVAIAGDTAVVGAPNDDGTKGAVFVLGRTGTSWAQTEVIAGSAGTSNFGAAVAFDGTTLVVLSEVAEKLHAGTRIYTLDGGAFAAAPEAPATNQTPVVFTSFLGVAVEEKTVVTGALDLGRAVVLNLVSPDGSACASAADCASSFCVDGVCCASPSCPAAGPCNAAEHCQAGTGTCSRTPIHEGMACGAPDACTHDTVCQEGACVGSAEVCAPANECREFGTCDPTTGACSSPPKPDGTTCAGGVCKDGACDTGSVPAPAAHGCGCGMGGERGVGVVSLGLGLVFLMRRRRGREN